MRGAAVLLLATGCTGTPTPEPPSPEPTDCAGDRSIATRDQLADFRAERCRTLDGSLFVQLNLQEFETLDLGPLTGVTGPIDLNLNSGTLVADALIDVSTVSI